MRLDERFARSHPFKLLRRIIVDQVAAVDTDLSSGAWLRVRQQLRPFPSLRKEPHRQH
jgi:hypothetical protein